MKTLWFLAFSLLASLSANAQLLGSDDQSVGLISTVSIYNHTYRGNLSPYLRLNYGSGSWAFGPLVLAASNVGSDVSNGPKLTGLRLAYQYSPQTESKRFEFYLGSEIHAQRIKDIWQANAFNPATEKFQNVSYKSVERILEAYAGYGIRLIIGSRWFLSNGVGAGFYLSKLHGNMLGSDVLETDIYDYRGYDDFGFSWNITLGAGYKF